MSRTLSRWITPTRFAWFLMATLIVMLAYVLGVNIYGLNVFA